MFWLFSPPRPTIAFISTKKAKAFEGVPVLEVCNRTKY